MKFLANENVPHPTIARLIKEGLDIKAISFDSPSISDDRVMERAILENRTIITFDRDYGELVFKYGYKPPAGIIYFRLDDFQPDQPTELLLNLLNNPDFHFTGVFTVVDVDNIRQRKY